MGFEPTRAEPIGLAVQRLNHSATSSLCLSHVTNVEQRMDGLILVIPKSFPRRELNPGPLGESQIS